MGFKTDEQKVNCLASSLGNIVAEFTLGTLNEESMYTYFAEFMADAEVDSAITVQVLEKPQFGEFGKNQAVSIKVTEGW